jgi:phospholipid transport system substrate-binding protein
MSTLMLIFLLAAADAPAASASPPPAGPATTKPAPAKPAKADAAKPAGKAAAKPDSKTKADGKADAKGAEAGAKAESKAEAPPASASPMAELKKSNDKLEKLLSKSKPNWTPEAELQREEVRKVVGGFLDYAELGKRSLAKHWDGLTSKQRTEFTDTLRELVERSYLKQLRGGSANYTIKFEREEKAGSEATVFGTLLTTARGKKVKIALEYKMLWRGDHWVVYDVVTDEQSMLENYRAEFNKVINRDGFDGLLKKMKTKLAEKDE